MYHQSPCNEPIYATPVLFNIIHQAPPLLLLHLLPMCHLSFRKPIIYSGLMLKKHDSFKPGNWSGWIVWVSMRGVEWWNEYQMNQFAFSIISYLSLLNIWINVFVTSVLAEETHSEELFHSGIFIIAMNEKKQSIFMKCIKRIIAHKIRWLVVHNRTAMWLYWQ